MNDYDETFGRMAFEAYKKSKIGTTYDNRPIPDWVDLGDEVRVAWVAAAKAVLDMHEVTASIIKDKSPDYGRL